MIFNLGMKTPDAADSVLSTMNLDNASGDDIETAKEMLSSILEYGEYLTVQCDTKDKSFRVLIKD